MVTHNNNDDFRSGFVSILGRPNVGKSCFLNKVLGEKTVIVSARPQTTRNKVIGVCNQPGGQIIFIDTPGIHKANTKLGRALVERSFATYHDADLFLFMTDASRSVIDGDRFILRTLEKIKNPVYLLINKVDLLKDKTPLLRLITEFRDIYTFADIFPVSAVTGENISPLLDRLRQDLPEGPRYFPEGMKTDQPEKFIMAEFIREKVFRLTGQEIPYVTAVTVDEIKPGKTKGVQVVYATIYVERQSQKGIVIGHRGKKLKEIGTSARQEMEKRFGSRIFLELFVKVKKNWSKDEKALYDFGYRG